MKLKKGFTLVELLVVLVIIGVLAAVATPLLFKHTQRAKISEAIAVMSQIRQAKRDYKISAGSYFNIKEETTKGNIKNGFPDSVTGFVPDKIDSGVDVDAQTAQYFSNSAYEVFADDDGTKLDAKSISKQFDKPDPVDFIIIVKGSRSVDCNDVSREGNCAIKNLEVKDFMVEMDNSGRIYVCFEDCDKTTGIWKKY